MKQKELFSYNSYIRSYWSTVLLFLNIIIVMIIGIIFSSSIFLL